MQFVDGQPLLEKKKGKKPKQSIFPFIWASFSRRRVEKRRVLSENFLFVFYWPHHAAWITTPTRDQTHTPCIVDAESWSLDHQGSPLSELLLLVSCVQFQLLVTSEEKRGTSPGMYSQMDSFSQFWWPFSILLLLFILQGQELPLAFWTQFRDRL